MSKKYIIEPTVILTLSTEYDGVSLAITNNLGDVLDLNYFNFLNIRNKIDENIFKQRMVNVIDKLIEDYNIDTFIMEENKLFVDKIDRYPDYYVLRNTLLDYSIHVTLEDKYLFNIKYFMVFPHYDWFSVIMNKNVRYEIDLYKSHILDKGFRGNEELLNEFNSGNYYKVLCLSECVEYSGLLNKKYQINYERGGKSAR